MRMLPLSALQIPGTEATMAVCLERAHTKFLGEGEGLVVVGFGLLDDRGITPRRNVTEEAQGIRLVPTFLVLAGECLRPLGECLRLPQAAGPQMRLSQGKPTERLKVYYGHRHGLLEDLREQQHGVGDTPT
jgi:hypothetical protein